jgi:hypothetical protein
MIRDRRKKEMEGGKQVHDKDKGKARGMTIKKTGKKERAYGMKY